jgi:thymidylate synthase (FAD)
MGPKVTLITWTNKPIETMYWAFMNMHNPIPDSLDAIHLEDEEREAFLDMLMKQPHQTVCEFINTVWKIDGASRAFQTQLIRTRTAAYSIQSLRIVDVGKFADAGLYSKSSKLKSKPLAEEKFDKTMKQLQEVYADLIKMGCPVEDARGILPLNIHSPITMAINLRALYHMLELRFCENTQEEYREVAEQMKQEIKTKMHPLLAKPMVPICFRSKKCPSPVYCGKYKFEQEVKADVSRWIKG